MLMYCSLVRFLIDVFVSFIFRIKICGIENIPDNRGCILCANHISNFDPIILRVKVKHEIRFVAKKELFSSIFLSWTLRAFGAIPVDRDKNDLQAYKSAVKTLKDKKILGIFIQGTRSKMTENENINLDGVKNGAAMFALKTNSPVIPVAIHANYKLFSLVKIIIGQPIYFDAPQKITHEILDNTSSLIVTKIEGLK